MSGDSAGENDPEPDDPAGRPSLEQRFAPWLRVRTTVLEDGLLVQVHRPFSERMTLVGWERLLLDPAGVRGLVRLRLLACALGPLLAGGAAALPSATWSATGAGPLVAAWLPLALLLGSALLLLDTIGRPRRVSMLLDRELALHPAFLRDRDDEPAVRAFLGEVRRAAIAWRCRNPEAEGGDGPDALPGLADTLDRLVAMHAEGLLDTRQLASFRDLALGR